jgi:N-acetylglucosaminyldiphosphoundecaprenol N-acetyl-beta-D-mannosaminyltransferase
MKTLGIHLDATNFELASNQIMHWIKTNESRYVCIANVHTLMEAHDSPEFARIINNADLVTPDGMPLVWMMRLKGQEDQQRVYGPSLMLHVLEAAARENIPVGFYGGKPDVLKMLVEKMQARYTSLNVAYSLSPPFSKIDAVEEEIIVERINRSGARILFVGLGCPKQEVWMAEHRGKIKAVMLGVGAAFDFHSGTIRQAPAWLQRIGLEWFFRLMTEPRRLWKRYLYHNSRFMVLAIADLIGL